MIWSIHRVSKKQAKLFLYNYVKLPLNLTIFGTKMANCLKLYEVHSFSTSANLCQCTTLLNIDVPNCHGVVSLGVILVCGQIVQTLSYIGFLERFSVQNCVVAVV